MSLGHNDGVLPRDVVDAITEAGDFPGKAVGLIKIHDTETDVQIVAEHAASVAEALDGGNFEGRTLRVHFPRTLKSPFASKPGDKKGRASDRKPPYGEKRPYFKKPGGYPPREGGYGGERSGPERPRPSGDAPRPYGDKPRPYGPPRDDRAPRPYARDDRREAPPRRDSGGRPDAPRGGPRKFGGPPKPKGPGRW